MLATPSNESTQARRLRIAAALALAAALLWWGGGLGTVAQAQSGFETPPVLKAGEVAPLAAVVAQGTVIGRSQSGALIVPGAVDYVAWTERVAGFAGRPDLQGTSGSLWITGSLSPQAQRQFVALGWTVNPHVLPPWQR
jgi:hypothetical protein